MDIHLLPWNMSSGLCSLAPLMFPLEKRMGSTHAPIWRYNNRRLFLFKPYCCPQALLDITCQHINRTHVVIGACDSVNRVGLVDFLLNNSFEYFE